MRKADYVDALRRALLAASSTVQHEGLPDEPLYSTVAWKGGFAIVTHDGGPNGAKADSSLQEVAEQVGASVTSPHPSYH